MGLLSDIEKRRQMEKLRGKAKRKAKPKVTTYTVDSYTGKYDHAMRSGIVPRSGERVRWPEDPEGTGQTADGREIDAFLKKLRDNGLQVGDYLHTHDGYDVYEIVAGSDDDW